MRMFDDYQYRNPIRAIPTHIIYVYNIYVLVAE